ncbi:hypothetical protein IE4872_PA00089 (plasmid) [Rhizobium gallicum]|uniref:Uncharacterized protein n=1 Tax=Rhizobium gallicum TaxID=56730 RepID=A0A1L5NPJ8_9HYPH|nr:hypothetical protein IE4872_PA00089 [Rhizobium gallicum]
MVRRRSALSLNAVNRPPLAAEEVTPSAASIGPQSISLTSTPSVVASAFESRSVRLGKDRRHFRRIQIAGFRYRRLFDWDVEDFRALRD